MIEQINRLAYYNFCGVQDDRIVIFYLLSHKWLNERVTEPITAQLADWR